jgi:hypothetical protein
MSSTEATAQKPPTSSEWIFQLAYDLEELAGWMKETPERLDPAMLHRLGDDLHYSGTLVPKMRRRLVAAWQAEEAEHEAALQAKQATVSPQSVPSAEQPDASPSPSPDRLSDHEVALALLVRDYTKARIELTRYLNSMDDSEYQAALRAVIRI